MEYSNTNGGDNMDILLWIILVLVLNTLMGGIGIVITGFVNDPIKLHFLSYLLMAFSAGTLLGGAFLHLFPHSFEEIGDGLKISMIALGSYLLFSIMEMYLHYHRCHECEIHPFTYLVLIGDGIHNIIDGIVIAASFLVSIPLGIATSIVIIAHEIPQELGIYGVEVHGGMDKIKSAIYAILAQSTSILGGLLGYFFLNSIKEYVPLLLPFAAGGFIYIASSDLIPELHKDDKNRHWGFLAMLVGVLLMYGVRLWAHAHGA